MTRKESIKERKTLYDEFTKQMDNFHSGNSGDKFHSRYLKKLGSKVYNFSIGKDNKPNFDNNTSLIYFCYFNKNYVYFEIYIHDLGEEGHNNILTIDVTVSNPSLDINRLYNLLNKKGFDVTKPFNKRYTVDVLQIEISHITKENIRNLISCIKNCVITNDDITDTVDDFNNKFNFFEIEIISTRGKTRNYYIISKDSYDIFYEKMYNIIPGNLSKKIADELVEIKKYIIDRIPEYTITREGMEDVFEFQDKAFIGRLTNK